MISSLGWQTRLSRPITKHAAWPPSGRMRRRTHAYWQVLNQCQTTNESHSSTSRGTGLICLNAHPLYHVWEPRGYGAKDLWEMSWFRASLFSNVNDTPLTPSRKNIGRPLCESFQVLRHIYRATTNGILPRFSTLTISATVDRVGVRSRSPASATPAP